MIGDLQTMHVRTVVQWADRQVLCVAVSCTVARSPRARRRSALLAVIPSPLVLGLSP
ncbi:hypothetical protein SGPA1_12126 [Streptomyces misionensis JCM 4497]